MRYKEGDKVVLKDLSKIFKDRTDNGIDLIYVKHLYNKILTIKNVTETNKLKFYDIFENGYCFREEYFYSLKEIKLRLLHEI
ncbi:MAG: hypothetical protein ABSG25_10305 [Bryobacteraceae bacterium]